MYFNGGNTTRIND